MIHRENGFTLVELLVALALTGITMVAVYKTFSAQEKVFAVQDDAASMQQDLRAAMEIMIKDFRMAGYSPNTAGAAGVTSAQASSCTFTADRNADGDVTDADEQITYSLSGGARPFRLSRTSGGVTQPVADNVDALDFVYVLADGSTTSAPAAADLTNIRAIQVTVVARGNRADKDYVNKTLYWNQFGPQPAAPAAPDPTLSLLGAAANDGFRRRLLTATVTCRNLRGYDEDAF
jgi:type IV pilus assembly protein PilW